MKALLVGTADGLHELGTRARAHHPGREITALARDGTRWWALLDGKELVRGTLSGEARWQSIAEVGGRRAHCLLPTSSSVLVGTSNAGLLRLRDGELRPVDSFLSVEGRKTWYTPWGAPPDTRSISRSAGGALFVNVHVGGVVRSKDSGRTWHPTMDVDADVHQVLAHPSDPDLVLAASAIGLGVSEDGGDQWRFEKKGLHATYQRAVTFCAQHALVSVSRSERGREAAVYRRALRGGGFERCRSGLPEWFPDNVNTGCLAASGRQAALGTVDGSVYVSEDEGESWRLSAEGLPKVRAVAFAT